MCFLGLLKEIHWFDIHISSCLCPIFMRSFCRYQGRDHARNIRKNSFKRFLCICDVFYWLFFGRYRQGFSSFADLVEPNTNASFDRIEQIDTHFIRRCFILLMILMFLPNENDRSAREKRWNLKRFTGEKIRF